MPVSALQTPFTPSDLTNWSIPHEIRLKYVKDVIFPKLFALFCKNPRDLTFKYIAEELNVDEWWCKSLIYYLSKIRGSNIVLQPDGQIRVGISDLLQRHCNYWVDATSEVESYLKEQFIPFVCVSISLEGARRFYFYTEDENKALYAKMLAGNGDKNLMFNGQKWFSKPFPIFDNLGVKGYVDPVCEFPYHQL